MVERARECGVEAPLALRLESFDDSSDGDARALVLATVPNDRVGELIERAREIAEDADVVVLPAGALPLHAPLDDVGQQIRDVSRLSTFEVLLGSLQSIGSWRGLLVYSALAGIIGAFGVIFDAGYLLVAAMLINPMAAPALVSVIGATLGDWRMAARGGARFLVSLALQSVAALLFGIAYGLTTSTMMMEQVTSLSGYAVLVALAAGAAGAQTQIKSDRDSLVSGTAAGFMVAAALAPPAAVLGLSVPLGRWDYAAQMALLLALQYAAIVAGGALTMALNGMRPADALVARGSSRGRSAMVALAAVATAALVGLQLARGPSLLKGDLSRRALEIASGGIETVEGASIVQVEAAFTRSHITRYDGEVLLVSAVVEQTDPGRSREAIEDDVRDTLRASFLDAMDGVVPLVDVTVLPGPSATLAAE